jgi:hypothetical protein
MAAAISFSLKGISTEQFAILESNYVLGENPKLGVSLSFGYNLQDRMIVPFVKCNFILHEKEFIILEVACHFQLDLKDWELCFNSKEDKLTVPKGFAQHLVMLTIGTARGVLHAKTEGTEFNRFFIPAVNVQSLICEDVVITE